MTRLTETGTMGPVGAVGKNDKAYWNMDHRNADDLTWDDRSLSICNRLIKRAVNQSEIVCSRDLWESNNDKA